MASLLALAPALLGTAGAGMNLLNGSPASHVQPGMNPLQFAGQTFQPAMNMGFGAVGNAPNPYADTLPQFGQIAQGLVNNPGSGTMIGGANTAAGMGSGAAGNLSGLGGFLAQMGQGLTPWAGNMLQQGSVQNPNTGSMMNAASDAARMGAQGGASIFNSGQSLFPLAGQALAQGSTPNANTGSLMQGAQGAANLGAGATGNLLGTGGMMQGVGQSLFPAASSILNAGFDPQQALYGRTQHQLQEQTRASEAARGLGNSPFGAGLENKAMSDFNIDWQNNQLGRMATGAQGAGSLLGTAGNYLTQGAGMIGQAPGMLSQTSALPYQAGQMTTSDMLRNFGQGVSNATPLLGAGTSMVGQAPGLTAQSGALPYQAGQTALGDILRNMLSGAQGAGMLLDQSGRDITGGASLMSQAPGLAASSSMLPYQAFNTIGQGGLGALQQYGQQGMAATQQPQQQLQDFYQMLGLGNQGAQVGNNMFANQLNQANAGFNQNQQMGQNLGNSLSMLGKSFGGAGGGSGGGTQSAFMPSASFMQNGMGWG